MKRMLIMSLVLVLIMLASISSACTKTVYVTETPASTSTQPLQSSGIPEMPGITISSSTQQQSNGYTLTEYDGTFTCLQQDSTINYLKGRIFLQGQPLKDWPPEVLWPSNYQKLIPGYVLIGINVDLGNPQWLYVRPGDTWQMEENQWPNGGIFDVYYWSPGYMNVMFESVQLDGGKTLTLPDVTLIPARYGVWLRPG